MNLPCLVSKAIIGEQCIWKGSVSFFEACKCAPSKENNNIPIRYDLKMKPTVIFHA
jgi:hypothetical protein